MPAPQGAASGSELTAGGGSLRRSARLQHQPPSQTAQPAKDAVEDTAASQHSVPKRITGRAAKLLTWEEQSGDAAATPRVKASASAPARKRQRTAEPPQRSASAPSSRKTRGPTAPPNGEEVVEIGSASDSEGGPAFSAAKRRRGTGTGTGKQVPRLSGPPQPALITFAGADEMPSRRFRSISAIYQAADAEDGGIAERPTRAASTAVKRTRPASQTGRTPQHAVTAEARRGLGAAGTVGQGLEPDDADQTNRKTPGRRTTRAAASKLHSSQLVTAEVDMANVLPQAKLPAGMTAAVAVSTRSHDGAARTDDGPAAVTSAVRGSRRRAGKPSAQPQPLSQDFNAQDVPANSDASSGDGQRRQLRSKQAAADKQQQAEAAQAAAAADEADAEQLGESADHPDGGDASASQAAAEEEGETGSDDSADDSDGFMQALASRMLASAAVGQSSDDEGSGAEDELEHGRMVRAEHDGSAAEQGFELDDELDEAAFRWEPETGLPAPLELDDTAGLPGAREQGLAKMVVAPVRDARTLAKEARSRRKETAGRGWFDLPATQITDEVKRDLRMLRLRGAFDPKRFYKSADATKFPKYFQMGTVVEGPTDFYSGRLARKERKQTFTEELLADRQLKQSHKRRFDRLQAERQKWRHNKVRKTGNERVAKRKPRPKH